MARKRKLPEGQAVLSIRIPEELHSRLKLVADMNDRDMAKEARRAITQHVEASEAEVAAAA